MVGTAIGGTAVASPRLGPFLPRPSVAAEVEVGPRATAEGQRVAISGVGGVTTGTGMVVV